MTSRDALNRLFEGMRADVADYGRLRDLLEEQFAAALAHRTEQIADLVERILGLTHVLAARSRERVELAQVLTGAKTKRVSIRTVAARLPAQARDKFDACWTTLEALVRECKRLNVRNGNLLMTQRDIMQRVLNTEPDTYAPV